MPFVVGENVGPYRVMDQLGQGGMATVYKAYHPALDRFVAVKAMHPVFLEDPSFLARFQREAQVVARLDHPNIVPVYDFSEYEGRPYLVMRYIDGETLKARMGRGSLDKLEATSIVKAVAEALSYAHSQGIWHRDIKPSNVLLSEGGKIYLADFGLARMAQAGQSTLSSDVMLGTPQYISPEQARGKTDLDAGTDIYSFGVMLYEIVTGQVPFNADTPYSIIHDHIYSPLPMPSTVSPNVGPSVEKVLMKALAKERVDRFDSVQELGEAFLQAWEFDHSRNTGALSLTPDSHLVGNSNESLPPGTIAARTGLADGEAISTSGTGEAVLFEIDDPQDEMASQIRSRLNEDRSNSGNKSKTTMGQRWRWWYLAPAMFAFCICGFVGLAAIGGMAEAGAGEEPGQATVGPPQQFDNQPGAVDQRLGLDEPAPGIPGDAPRPGNQAAEAQRRVNENPADPIGYLELALAYFEAGNIGAAQTALDQGAAVAGDQHPYYYIEAAALLGDLEYWLQAAEMYFKLAQVSARELSPEIRDQADMAIFLATQEPGSRLLINLLDEQGGLETFHLDTLNARFQLYQGRPEAAQAMLDRVNETEPGFGPALLVQAEIFLNVGEMEEAGRLLDEIVSENDQDSWVRAIAAHFLSELRGPG